MNRYVFITFESQISGKLDHVWFAGTSLTKGYYLDPKETCQVLPSTTLIWLSACGFDVLIYNLYQIQQLTIVYSLQP